MTLGNSLVPLALDNRPTSRSRAHKMAGGMRSPLVQWSEFGWAGNYIGGFRPCSLWRKAVSPNSERSHSRSTLENDSWIGIVDDDASIRKSLARMFRGNGIRTMTFESAEEYLDRCVIGE